MHTNEPWDVQSNAIEEIAATIVLKMKLKIETPLTPLARYRNSILNANNIQCMVPEARKNTTAQ